MRIPSLWLLTIKNLKILIRSKSSALIVIFAPLLIILILGLSYNTSEQYGLNIGVYSRSFTDDVNSFITTLQEEEFKLVKYQTSIEECVEDIKVGAIHTCISLPETFKIEDNSPKEVTFYVDPSRINLVWMIQETLKAKLNFKSQQIAESLTEDILNKMTSTKTKINEKKNELDAIKVKSSITASSASSAQSSLEKLDLSSSDTDYTSILNNLTEEIEIGIKGIDDAIDAVDDSSLNDTEKSEVKGELKSAKRKLITLQESTNGTGSLSLLVSDLTSAKNKLNTASAAVSTATTNLGTIASSLNEVAGSLSNVQNALTEMYNVLEEQKVTEAGTIAKPLVTKIEKISKEGTYLNYTFPTLLILVIMFTSLLLGTTLVMMEKNSPAFLRNFLLPVRKIVFVTSVYLTNLILTLIQIIIILGISLFFIPNTLGSLPSIALILFISASVFTFLGMTIGYIFTSEETGMLASISLGSLLLFVSGVVLPVESVSPLVRKIINYSPFVLSEKLVREVFIFQSPLATMGFNLIILVGYALGLFVIILLAESILHKNVMNRFLKHHHKFLREKEKKEKKYA